MPSRSPRARVAPARPPRGPADRHRSPRPPGSRTSKVPSTCRSRSPRSGPGPSLQTVGLPEMALIKSIAVLAVLLAAIAYFSIRARQLYRILRLGPTENRFDHIPERIRGVLSYVGLHTRMFRNLYSGTLHLFIFYGFVVLLTAIIQAFGEGIFPGFSLALIGGTTWIAFLQDLFGVLVLVGVLMALVNRLIIRPRQFHESNEIDARENLFKTVRDAPPVQRREPQRAQKLIGEA